MGVHFMQAKLRQIGNSIGMTIPASELKALCARPGDTVELQITKVIRNARVGWENPSLWKNVNEEPLHLESLSENNFDKKEWAW